MWALLFGLGGTVIDWITKLYALMTLKEWVVLAACATTLLMATKLVTAMFEFFKTMLQGKVMRWVLGLGTLMITAFGLGYFTSPTQTIPLHNKATNISSSAIIKDGEMYYPGSFINKYLKARGIKEHFKESLTR